MSIDAGIWNRNETQQNGWVSKISRRVLKDSEGKEIQLLGSHLGVWFYSVFLKPLQIISLCNKKQELFLWSFWHLSNNFCEMWVTWQPLVHSSSLHVTHVFSTDTSTRVNTWPWNWFLNYFLHPCSLSFLTLLEYSMGEFLPFWFRGQFSCLWSPWQCLDFSPPEPQFHCPARGRGGGI